MKNRNKATLMLGVLAAAAAMNFALAVPSITYAVENDSSKSNFEKMRNAFEKEQQKSRDKITEQLSSEIDSSKAEPFKDSTVDIIVELDSAAAIKHIKHRPDGSRKRLKEIDSVSDSVIGEQDSLKDAVDSVTKHKNDFDSKKDHSFGYLVNAFTTKAKLSEIDKIAKLKGVKSVGEVKTYTPQDAGQNDLDKVQEAWNGVAIPGLKLHGEGMVIAIVDTGIDYKHNDLSHAPDSARLSEDSVNELIATKGLKGRYLSPKIPYAYNYADENSTDVADLDRNTMHGMHVAGIAGADGTDYLKDSARDSLEKAGKPLDQAAKDSIDSLVADDIHHIDGAAPQAQLLDLKIFSNGFMKGESCTTPTVVAAIEDAVKLGADVISMSIGSDNGITSEDLEDVAIEKAAEQGVISVVAAGNAGDYNSLITTAEFRKGHGQGVSQLSQTVGAPSVNPYALSVAASQNKSAQIPGLEIFGEDEKQLKAFDNVDGKLIGMFSRALYDSNEQLKDFPDSNYNIVTLKDNHAAYWNSMRKDINTSVVSGLSSAGISLVPGMMFSEDSFDKSGVKRLGLGTDEVDVPNMPFSPWEDALHSSGVIASYEHELNVLKEDVLKSRNPFDYDFDSFGLGQGFKTDLDGYSGNWHNPFDSEVDSSEFPGTDVRGKIVIVPWVRYQGYRNYRPEKTLSDNLDSAGAAGVIYVAPKSGSPRTENDYVTFALNRQLNDDFHGTDIDFPAIVIPADDGVKLAKKINELNEEAIKAGKKLPEYNLKNTYKNVENTKRGRMAEYSSYGPSEDLELKPEITAVGSNVWSLKNNNAYQSMSGTSMATPQTSGITALLLQHLKSLTGHKTGKDLIKQSKNLLMNSATPIFESPFSSDYMNVQTDNPEIKLDETDKLKWSDVDLRQTPASDADKETFAKQETLVSPRRQGAGEVNASKALSTTTSLTDKKDGDVSLALKEIGAHTSFSVVLKNFGNTTKSYKLDPKYNHVYAQNDINDLDSDDNHYAVCRSLDFPLKESVASLTLSKGYDETITLEPGKEVEISGTLDLKDPNFKANWLEGYIGVQEVGSDETAVIPYFGYTGHIDDNPIFDKFAYEDGSIGNQQRFEETCPVGPGRMLGVDYSFEHEHAYFDENKIAYASGNADAKQKLIPYISLLRNTKNLQFNILDNDKKLIKTLKTTAYESPSVFSYFGGHFTYSDKDINWNGTKKNATTGLDEQVSDGQYYYQLKGTGTHDGDTEQTKDIPIIVDNTKPEISDVKFSKALDGKYYVDFTLTENGSGFYNAEEIGVGANGRSTSLGTIKELLGQDFKGSKPVHQEVPEYIASEIVDGKNDFFLAVDDVAGNTGIFEKPQLLENGEPSDTQGFRLQLPVHVGADSSAFVVIEDESQIDVINQLVHVKGYSDKEFYINKETKITPDANHEFSTWVHYDANTYHSKLDKIFGPSGQPLDHLFERARDLVFSYDAEGVEQFATASFATDALASDGQPVLSPDNQYDKRDYFEKDGLPHGYASDVISKEINRLKAEGVISTDKLRGKEPIWLTEGYDIAIDSTQSYRLGDSEGEMPIARVSDERRNDHFAVINLTAGEYEKEGKVYSKDNTELPAQSFRPDISNHNAIKTNFKTVDNGNVIEVRDLDCTDYTSYSFVYQMGYKGIIQFDASYENGKDYFLPNEVNIVNSAKVKSGFYKITNPATGDGTYKLGVAHGDDFRNAHVLAGDEKASEANEFKPESYDPITGFTRFVYNLNLKNTSESYFTFVYDYIDYLSADYDAAKQLSEEPVGLAKNMLDFYVDVTAPTLKLSDKFKHTADNPNVDNPLNLPNSINDLGEYTINSTNGKLDLDGVFGDNQGDFNLRVNGSMVFHSKNANREGIWPADKENFKDVDYKDALKLIPGVDNYFEVDVTDLAGNVTRAHIWVTQNGSGSDVTPPSDDSSTDSQNTGEPQDSTVPTDSQEPTVPTDSTEPQDSTDPATPSDTQTPAVPGTTVNVVTSDSLVDANRGGVSIDSTQMGRDIRIAIDSPSVNAGDTITAYIYSDPTLLGTYTVQEDSNG
ncbi:MAG: S8 family serine peptidase, partial [Lactobacillales bacterium]|nr:S8 family serine peptidase [Lactobacillales bacterium]